MCVLSPRAWRSKMNPSEQGASWPTAKSAVDVLRRFGAASQGFAAMEFALITPAMLLMYFGVTELSDGYSAYSKVTTVVSTAADLVAQEKKVCNAEISDIFEALDAIIFPYPSADMQVVISSLVSSGGNVRVAWSDAHNASPRAVDSIVSVPTGLVAEGKSVVFAEVTYAYRSPAGKMLYEAIPMSTKAYFAPRQAAQIPRSASAC
jgi:Flp pilus assembly protein TadG